MDVSTFRTTSSSSTAKYGSPRWFARRLDGRAEGTYDERRTAACLHIVRPIIDEKGQVTMAGEDELKEKTWVLGSPERAYQRRKSSTGCEVDVYVRGEKITCGTFEIPPGKRLGRISAHAGDETYYVVKGTLQVELPRLAETVEVKEGEVFYMPGGMIHAPFNDGEESCVVLWNCAPQWP